MTVSIRAFGRVGSMRGVSIAAVLLVSVLAHNVAFGAPPPPPGLGPLPPPVGGPLPLPPPIGGPGHRPHPGGPPHLGAPAPLIGSGLPSLLLAGGIGVYWLVRRRRRDPQAAQG
jgi:hypothetical protein